MANKSVTKVNRIDWHNKKKALIVHLVGGEKVEIPKKSGVKAASDGKKES